MFTNLIESESHVREFKRRSSFFLITVAAYAVILFAAGIASVCAYDAQLEAQTSDLIVDYWVPPITPATAPPPRDVRPVIRRTTPSAAPVDLNVTRSERTQFVSTTDDPRKVPEGIAIKGDGIPPITPGAILSTRNVDPPALPNSSAVCVTCNTEPPRVRVDDKPPEPVPPKPKTEHVPSTVLVSKAISLPQPPYPIMAKQIGLHGTVSVQILVDEQGKVVSAQVVSGHPILSGPARDAAMRARFTPTILNGAPVKIQGVINYNFVMQ